MTSGTAPNTSVILTDEELDLCNSYGSKSRAIHDGLRLLKSHYDRIDVMKSRIARNAIASAAKLPDISEENQNLKYQIGDEDDAGMDPDWELYMASNEAHIIWMVQNNLNELQPARWNDALVTMISAIDHWLENFDRLPVSKYGVF